MPFWKSLLLNLYYHGTRPVRWWNVRRYAAKDWAPITILYYHRIADDAANPWTISNAMFARQMAWLRERFQLISLQEIQRRIRSGRNREPCIGITFDDGYADNCQQAVPLLVKERIPCTYFVTVRNMLTGEPFEHDLRMGNRLNPNSPDELRAMAASGIEIGVHAYTHSDLGAETDPRRLHHEIVAAKEKLDEVLGLSTRYFAFPFGQYANLNPAAFAIAQRAGFAGVCSAYGGYNFPRDDAFHLQRIPVDDNMIRMKNWVTIDPGKLRTARYEWRVASSERGA